VESLLFPLDTVNPSVTLLIRRDESMSDYVMTEGSLELFEVLAEDMRHRTNPQWLITRDKDLDKDLKDRRGWRRRVGAGEYEPLGR
jgi:hypothetical protein